MGLKETNELPAVTQNSTQLHASLEHTNWDDLRVFAAVAREGSLRKAARQLGIKAPSVRRRIDSLEAQLEMRLFDRGPQGFALTKEGKRIAHDAQSMEMILQDSLRRARTSETDIRGECKLSLSEGLATAWLIPYFFDAFTDLYPNLVLRLGVTQESDRIVVPPFDIQIRYAPPTELDLKYVRLGTFHFTYFASEKYIRRYGRPTTHDDLAKHRFADVTTSLTSDVGILATYSNAEALAHAALRTNSGLVVSAAVANGSVIGLMPSYAYITRQDLIPVLPDLHYETGIFAVFSETSRERSSVRGVLDFLKKIAFDRRNMSWFADEYEVPTEGWHDEFAIILARCAALGAKVLQPLNT